MTPRERATEATWDTGGADWMTADRERLESRVEQAIIAAVEADRRTRPHEFVGRSDRWCELCDKPDRDAVHLISRERLSRSIDHAVEAEREACGEQMANLRRENEGLRELLRQSRHLYGRNGKESVEIFEQWRRRVETVLTASAHSSAPED